MSYLIQYSNINNNNNNNRIWIFNLMKALISAESVGGCTVLSWGEVTGTMFCVKEMTITANSSWKMRMLRLQNLADILISGARCPATAVAVRRRATPAGLLARGLSILAFRSMAGWDGLTAWSDLGVHWTWKLKWNCFIVFFSKHESNWR